LKERESLKAALFIKRHSKHQSLQLFEMFAFFPGGSHDIQVLHRRPFKSLLTWAWHGYMDQTI
jgi:hypothetical protein